MNIKSKAKQVVDKVDTKRPEIFTGLGIVLGITAAVKACKATPEAIKLVEEAKKAKEQESNDKESVELSAYETVQAGIKPYIPSLIMGVGSIALIISANRISFKRTAALSTAYKISEKALLDYKDAVIETVGVKKAEEDRKRVAAKQVEKNPPEENKILVVGDNGIWCMESFTGRYFQTDVESIRHAENEINRILLRDGNASYNELCNALNIDGTTTGDELGWNQFRLDKGLIEFYYDTTAIMPNGKPCLVLSYSKSPEYGYTKSDY